MSLSFTICPKDPATLYFIAAFKAQRNMLGHDLIGALLWKFPWHRPAQRWCEGEEDGIWVPPETEVGLTLHDTEGPWLTDSL